MNSQLFHKWIPYGGIIDQPIVFIHGFLETHSIWYHLPLSKLKRPILLLDVPGFGKSNLYDDNLPSISYFANEIIQLLDIYQLSGYDLVGHSMGGYIGLEMLENHQKANRLILLNSNFWTDSEAKKIDRTRFASLILQSKDLLIQEVIPSLFLDKTKNAFEITKIIQEAKKGIAEWFAYATIAMRERKDFTDFVKKYSHKIEIIHGEKDNLVTTEQLEAICKDWKNIHLISNTGHMSLFEQATEVVEILNEILSK